MLENDLRQDRVSGEQRNDVDVTNSERIITEKASEVAAVLKEVTHIDLSQEQIQNEGLRNSNYPPHDDRHSPKSDKILTSVLGGLGVSSIVMGVASSSQVLQVSAVVAGAVTLLAASGFAYKQFRYLTRLSTRENKGHSHVILDND
ncbi:MAG: hypothetical protein KDD56_02690 [Bdellovibrionales bacterium]|nr:hypothetical protein [Bdellovibrionales bacterium]